MEKKAWWRSKTLWLNVIGGGALIAQSQFGFIVDAETQGALLAVINLFLRFITREPIGLKSESAG